VCYMRLCTRACARMWILGDVRNRGSVRGFCVYGVFR